VDGLFEATELHAPWFDLATRHDAPERVTRLAERLKGGGSAADAWLLGPWLGTAAGVAERLTALVGKPCGETTSPPGGPAGARFDAARDALFSSIGVTVRRERVDSFSRRGARFLPLGATPDLTARDAGHDVVVLATGGLVGGGLVLDRGRDGNPPRFRPMVGMDLVVGLGGQVLDPESSLHGVDLIGRGMATLEKVGVLAEGPAARGVAGLFVAGDCVADRPRCALEAARAGIAAARAAVSSRR
jgi:glycerol-3-phosphate dehydrogenase subunit B